MINALQALARLAKHKDLKNKPIDAWGSRVFVQEFFPAAGGAPTQFDTRQFPVDAIILGITAGAFVPGAAASAQTARNRQLFAIDFSYLGGEPIVIDGPVQADVLLGGGDATIFPARELIIRATQSLQCRVANLTDGELTVNVAYHCLVDKHAP